jgi:hypothetical protein
MKRCNRKGEKFSENTLVNIYIYLLTFFCPLQVSFFLHSQPVKRKEKEINTQRDRETHTHTDVTIKNKRIREKLGTVMCIYNPTYSGGRNRRITVLAQHRIK